MPICATELPAERQGTQQRKDFARLVWDTDALSGSGSARVQSRNDVVVEVVRDSLAAHKAVLAIAALDGSPSIAACSYVGDAPQGDLVDAAVARAQLAS